MQADMNGEGVKTFGEDRSSTLVKGGEGRDSDKNKSKDKNREETVTPRKQTLPWQAPVRWFGMNPLRQG